MPAPSEAHLTKVRAEAVKLMPQTATIQRAVETNSGTGVTTVWSTVATVACRLAVATHRPATEIDLVAKDAVRSITFWTVRFPYGTDIRDKDRFVVDGETYEISGVQAVRAHDTVVRCMVVRLR